MTRAVSPIVAGNLAQVTFPFEALPDHGNLAGTTVTAYVVYPDRTVVEIEQANIDVTVEVDAVTAVVDWLIPDDAERGWYVVYANADGPLEAISPVPIEVLPVIATPSP
jgi:hypothetical protein